MYEGINYDSTNASISGNEINDSNSTSNVILNGIENTLKVVGTGNNILTNSIINAYGTAVEFDNAGGSLTLSGTTINIQVM